MEGVLTILLFRRNWLFCVNVFLCRFLAPAEPLGSSSRNERRILLIRWRFDLLRQELAQRLLLKIVDKSILGLADSYSYTALPSGGNTLLFSAVFSVR